MTYHKFILFIAWSISSISYGANIDITENIIDTLVLKDLVSSGHLDFKFLQALSLVKI